MVRFDKAVRKYLADHAEPEAGAIEGFAGTWSQALTVPARREAPDALHGVVAAARAAAGRVLVILVVNGETGDEATEVANRELLRATGAGPRGDGEAVRLERGETFDVLVIDRATPGRYLPPKRGVGLARKIGTDVALALRAAGRLESPWLHASDADATQPTDRFTAAPPADVMALWHPWVHEPCGDESIDEATAFYDLFLRYSMNGLRWAGSPWAFPTIGSAMTFRAEAYAAVRGYPRREAGEDFYLMSKLAKLGGVAEADTGPVRLRARASDRVPFGTGAGVARILREREAGEPFRLDHPGGFGVLKLWQAALAGGRWREREHWPSASRTRTAGEAALAVLGARAALADLPEPARVPWFDAFRTLRFLHEVRDRGFPPVPWEAALHHAASLGISETGYPERFRRRPTAPPATSPAQSSASPADAPALRPESGK